MGMWGDEVTQSIQENWLVEEEEEVEEVGAWWLKQSPNSSMIVGETLLVKVMFLHGMLIQICRILFIGHLIMDIVWESIQPSPLAC